MTVFGIPGRRLVHWATAIMTSISAMPGALIAQCPCGNTGAMEWGDVAYRELSGWPDAVNYNHAGVFSGIKQSTGEERVMHSVGWTANLDTTREEAFTVMTSGTTYYGAYTSFSGSGAQPGFTSRRAILLAAEELVNAAKGYEMWNAINYAGLSFNGTVADILDIRCDGFSEYVYEKSAWMGWFPYSTPANWSILDHVGDHNDAPDLTRNPDTECSPWAQRGAPGHPTNFGNTKFRPSVVDFPTYEITQLAGVGFTNVTVRATDRSGINAIGFQRPEDAGWQSSGRQSQFPANTSFSYAFNVTTTGYVYYYAVDGGGNQPLYAQSVWVDVASPSSTTSSAQTSRSTTTVANSSSSTSLSSSSTTTIGNSSSSSSTSMSSTTTVIGGSSSSSTSRKQHHDSDWWQHQLEHVEEQHDNRHDDDDSWLYRRSL